MPLFDSLVWLLQVRLSGLREAYFGTMLRDQQSRQARCLQRHGSGECRSNASATGLPHIARFVESFETPEHDLWLVGTCTVPWSAIVVCHRQHLPLVKAVYSVRPMLNGWFISQVFHDEGRSLHSMMYGHAPRPGAAAGDSRQQHAELVQQSAGLWALRKYVKVQCCVTLV